MTTNSDEEHGDTNDDVCCENNEDTEVIQNGSIVSPNKFCVDYSKRGNAKCRKCKKVIEKNLVRIGKFVVFKSKVITHYYHLKCAFLMFEKTRLQANVIKDIGEIDGVDIISEDDRKVLIEEITAGNAKRINDPGDNTNISHKIPRKKHIVPSARKKKLISRTEPAIKIMFANADQLTTTKKAELLARIQQECPMIVAITEAKPKNSSAERSLIDYEIDNYSLHPTNLLNTEPGRGIAVYTHKSIEKSIADITTDIKFE